MRGTATEQFTLFLCRYIIEAQKGAGLNSSCDERSQSLGTNPPGIEQTLISPPKLTKVGVSSDFVPDASAVQGSAVAGLVPAKESSMAAIDEDDKIKWYVLRIRYNNDKKSYAELQAANISTFYATHPVDREIHGKLITVDEPLLPGFLFAHTSKNILLDFMHSRSPMAEHVKFYRNRTEAKTDKGKNPPLIVKDKVMESFIAICNARDKHTRLLTEKERKDLVPGALVRVVRGYFKGVVGRLIKVNRQHCILVDIDGVCSIKTAYVPKPLIEIISQ